MCVQRYSHNELEKQRRAKMRQLFEGLRREVGITEKMSKVFTLNRVRVQSYPHTLTAARSFVGVGDQQVFSLLMAGGAGDPEAEDD